MSDPTLIADLIRAGVDADLVQRVVNVVADSRPTNADTADRRRARDREYRRNKRALEATAKANDVAVVSADKTPTEADKRCDLTSLPLLTETAEKKEVVVAGRGSRGSRLPADWQPAAAALDLGAKLGFRLFEIESAAEEFRDYWHALPGSRALKTDWDKTFNNRLRAIAERRRPKNDQRNNVIDAADRLVERMRGLRSTEGPPDVRLLPSNRGGRS